MAPFEYEYHFIEYEYEYEYDQEQPIFCTMVSEEPYFTLLFSFLV